MLSRVALAVGLLILAAVAGLGVGGLLAEQGGQPPGPGTATTLQPPPSTGEGTSAEPEGISLAASTSTSPPNERLTLSGTYAGAAPGAPLQVQRQEGGEWVDFPVTTRAGSDGSFSVEVSLGQPGDNVLRVLDTATGTASEPVTVTIG